MRPDNHGARGGIGAEDVADEEIAATELLFVFIDRESGEKIAAGALFVRIGEGVESLLEHLVSGAGAEFEKEMLVGAGDGERFADGTTSLAHDRLEAHAVEGNGERIGRVADSRAKNSHVFVALRSAGQPTEHWCARISAVPFAQPSVGIEAKGVGESQPCRGGRSRFFAPE